MDPIKQINAGIRLIKDCAVEYSNTILKPPGAE